MSYRRPKSWEYNALCDICGFQFKNWQLRKNWKNQMVCAKDFEFRHPLDFYTTPNDTHQLQWTRSSRTTELVNTLRFVAGQYVQLPRVSLSTTGTIECWFNLNLPENNITPPVGDMIIMKIGSDRDNWTIRIVANSGEIYGTFYSNGLASNIASSGANYQNNHWHHVAMTLGSTAAKLYLDGTLVATGTETQSVPTNPNSTISAVSSSFVGDICEVRVWNVVRTLAQIQALKDQRALGNESGLIGLWHLDDGNPYLSLDQTLNMNNGVKVNLPQMNLTNGPLNAPSFFN